MQFRVVCVVGVVAMVAGCRFAFEHEHTGVADAGADTASRPDVSDPDASIDCTVETSTPLQPDAFYATDFNSTLDGWVATDEQNGAGFVDATLEVWGGFDNEYWGPAFESGDRGLYVFKSSETKLARWQRTFTNTTPDTITGVAVTYDVELAWARFQGADPALPEFGFRGGRAEWWMSTPSDTSIGIEHVSPFLDNTAVGELVPVTTWLCDADMDRSGLSARGVEWTQTGLSIAPGDSFSISVGAGVDSDKTLRHVNIGIDNLSLRVVTQ